MITAGIDAGIEYIKAVVLKDGRVVARAISPSGGSGRARSIEQVWQEALKQAGITAADVSKVVATGLGKWDAAFASSRVVEPVADARAAVWLSPSARAVIDIGADQARAVQYNAEGKIQQYTLNHKCAAGLGLFLESMAMTLGISLEEMSGATDHTNHRAQVNDQCAALAELDVVLMIHDNVPRASIIQAINEAVAAKLSAMLNEMLNPVAKEAVLIGGVAANTGVANAFKQRLGIDLIIPEQPQFAGALGAALIAAA
jgi:predicted CoA-substrate-specific enzyme activase